MRRLALTGALLMLCTNTAAGCRQQEKQEVTPEVLMDAVDKNMKEVNSASSSLEIEVELEMCWIIPESEWIWTWRTR